MSLKTDRRKKSDLYSLIGLIILLTVLPATGLYAAPKGMALDLKKLRDGQSLPGSGAMSFLRDDYGLYRVGDMGEMTREFIPWTDGTFDLGRTTTPVWLDFTLNNRSLVQNWVLDFGIHKFLTVELYRESSPDHFILEESWSYKKSFNERIIPEASLAFPLRIRPGGDEHFIMKVRSENGLILPIRIYSENDYLEKNFRLKTMWAVFYAVSAVMVLYNLMIWLFIRDQNYLYYVIYVILNMLYLSALNGAGAQFLWPGLEGRWTTIFSPLFGGVTLAFGIQLCRTFLGIKQISRKTHIYLNILIALSFLLAISNLMVERFMLSFALGNALGALIMISIMTIALIHSIKGNRPARLFLSSYMVIVMGQLGYSLKALGYFEGQDWLIDINQYTPVFQVTLLSLALSYRISVMRDEKDLAQAAALNAETILNERLEEKVNERTLELRIANDRLKTLSDIDGLTGLYNRRFFDRHLSSEWRRHQRSGLSMALIFCDIDHFKMFNDAAGHQEGDECLKEIAAVLKRNARRDADIAARYGGEEFAIIVPQMEMEGALKIARNVLEEIRALSIPHPAFSEESKFVTMSFGVAALVPRKDENESLILKEADRALYASKGAGRDTITAASVFQNSTHRD